MPKSLWATGPEDQGRSCMASYDLVSEVPHCHLSHTLLVISKSQVTHIQGGKFYKGIKG